MRTRYLVAYDIADPARWRKVHRTMRGFGDAVQLSVFRCDLSPSERVLLVEALSLQINHREDRVLIASLGPADGRGGESVEVLGRSDGSASRDGRVTVVV